MTVESFGLALMFKKLVIEDYDPRWAELYEDEKLAILDAIGYRLVDLQHIGSTAVPGLGAKPIVDVMGGLFALTDTEACIPRLEMIGYTFVPEAMVDLPDDRYFEKWSDGREIAHLHLTEHDSWFWRRHLLFRDFLRANPKAAREYESLKRELAPRFTSGSDYASAKSDFIRAIIEMIDTNH